jgi:hypothetical protein
MGTLHPAIRRSIQFREDIPDELRIRYPRLHFCPDHGHLLINDDDPEFEDCSCYYRDGKEWVNEGAEDETA